MTKKTWTIFILVCAGLLSWLIFASQSNKTAINVDDVKVAEVIAPNKYTSIGDHVYGKRDSKVVIVEYGDYQCGGCAGNEPLAKKLRLKYQDSVAFVFRTLIISGHQNARAATSAAEAAGLQDKFWEMHGKIYEHQDEWATASASERTDLFKSYALELGLNVDKFLSDMDGQTVKDKIAYDAAIVNKHKVAVTPTFFVNGEKVSDEDRVDEAKFSKLIDDALAK